MNKTNKKGFTLVELLVVIAILAILATVSVVGYTAFIERATVSNDENVAAQLNQFLTAMKADSTGDFYGKEVTPDNVWKVVDTMLKENGSLTELKPQSLDYGYNYYFKFSGNEVDGYQGGEIVVLKDIASTSPLEKLSKVFADDTKKYNGMPGFFYDQDNNLYFFIDTTGTKLSIAIRGFYTFDGIETEGDQTAWDVFQEAVDKAAQNGEPDYRDNLNSTIFVTKGDNKVTEEGVKKNAVIHDGVNSIKDSEGVDFSNVENMNIPDSVQVIDNGVLGQLDGATITTDKTPEEIKGMIFEDNSTGSSATITIKSGSTTITITITGDKNEIKNNGQDVEGEYFSNPMTDFDAKFTASVENKVSGNYVAWDVKTFEVEMFNPTGEKGGLPVSESKIEWSSDDATVTVASNGTITIAKNPNEDGFTSNVTIKVKSEEGVEKAFTVNFVYLESVTYTLDGKDIIANSDIDLLYGAENISSYTLVQGFKTNVDVPDQMVLDTAAKIVNADSKFELNGETLTLKSSTSYGTEALAVQPGKYDYLKKSVSTTLFNADSLVFHKDNENIQFVGNTGAEITAGDLFKLNLNDSDIPDDAQIWLITELGDTKFSLKNNVSMATEIASTTKINLDSNDWKSTKITFKANGGADFTSDNNAVVTAVIVSAAESIRISDQHTIRIVDGKNVRSFSDLNSDSNNVLISKLSGTTSFELNKGKTLYGNGFVIDFTKYDDTKTSVEALIYLDGAIIDNTKIIGNAYKSSDFVYQDPQKSAYGSSLVKALDGSTVKNSYLANTRSPLKIAGSVVVENSVIFGGNYANIDVSEKATALTLKGTITTINQVTKDTPDTVGFGIAVDIFAPANTKIDLTDCTLKQFNYVKQSDASKLPSVTMDFSIEDVTVVVGDEVKTLLNSTAHHQYIYTDSAGVKYFNTGVAFLNGIQIDATKTLMTGKEQTVDAETLARLVGVDIIDSNGGKFTSGSNNNYSATSIVIQKGPKTIDIKLVKYTITIYANVYFKVPTVTKSNNEANFQNDIAAYLPSKYLTEN